VLSCCCWWAVAACQTFAVAYFVEFISIGLITEGLVQPNFLSLLNPWFGWAFVFLLFFPRISHSTTTTTTADCRLSLKTDPSGPYSVSRLVCLVNLLFVCWFFVSCSSAALCGLGRSADDSKLKSGFALAMNLMECVSFAQSSEAAMGSLKGHNAMSASAVRMHRFGS
jgi:hypothetical protein